MPDVLRLVRRMAIAGIVLSIVLLPLGLIVLVSAVSPDLGDNGFGDAIGFGLGVTYLVLGVAGVLLGSGMAILAKRTLRDPVKVDRSRRIALAAGLTLAAGEVVLAAAFGGGWLVTAVLVGAFSMGFLIVAISSRKPGDTALAGVLVVALLIVGALPLWRQASENDVGSRRAERVATLPADMSAAVAAASAAAPEGWAVAGLAARLTDFAPSEELGYLPSGLVGTPLRGIVVVDCAGSEHLAIVALDGESPVALGTIACGLEPQVGAIDVPGFTVRSGTADYVLGIEVRAVGEGSTGSMNRALLLVAPTGTPDPDRPALLASFVAAFGTERPR